MTTAQDLPVELARVTRLLAEHPHLTPYEVEAVLRAVSRNAQPA